MEFTFAFPGTETGDPRSRYSHTRNRQVETALQSIGPGSPTSPLLFRMFQKLGRLWCELEAALLETS